MISLVRVDNRLIHGQVIEAWLPYLKVSRVLVADDQAAGNPLARAAMGLAVPRRVQVDVQPLGETDFADLERSPEAILLVVRDISGVLFARRRGLVCRALNLGNVHFSPGRAQVTPSVFLSQEEVGNLEELAAGGMQIEIRAVPRERPLPFAEILTRLGAHAAEPKA
ncbi:MAG TPA: PTS sorbose transporter subunit IIC [Myxococcales bacterium]|jgi:PTS system mannose-specific IIB component|nr:PTS sorbose transporter subunit IIC [Myxococcales bacterium]